MSYFSACISLGLLITTHNVSTKVDVNMLNAVKSVLAHVSSVGPSSEQNGSLL